MTLNDILRELPYLTTEERGKLRHALVKLPPMVEQRKGRITKTDRETETPLRVAGRKEGSGY